MSVAVPRIACMFEYPLERLAAMSGADLARAVAENHAAQLHAENQTLVLAAAWADLHSIDPTQYSPLVERASAVGGPGTPEIAEFCCLEFGALLGVGMIAGRAVIADALDVRHRLPLLWERVLAGQVRAWKARRIADTTRHLGWDEAAEVDHAVAGLVETLPCRGS